MFPTSEELPFNVEGLNDARTKLADVFSILLVFPNPVHDEIDHGCREAV